MGSGINNNNNGGLAAMVQEAGKIARHRHVSLFEDSEESLDREIAREEQRGVPKTKLGQARRKGEQLLHSKYVLILVIILNFVDILLVLGELMLDIHYITDLLTKEHQLSNEFIASMKRLYPYRLGYLDSDDIRGLEQELLSGHTTWNASGETFLTSNHRRERREGGSNISNEAVGNMTVYRSHAHAHSIEVDIAHGLHKASIAIVGILCVEVLLKMFCFGKELLQHKLECFDVFIVISSFIVDLATRKGLQQFATPEFAVILSFLVPWRFIRVANSLIVAVMDHEHFRIKVLYKKKKEAQKALQEANDDIKGLEACVDTLQKLCNKAGLAHDEVQEKIQRALQGNVTLTELVECTIMVGSVTLLDSSSPALIRRAILEDRVKRNSVIQPRGRSRTWTGSELSRERPKRALRLPSVQKPSPLATRSPTPSPTTPGSPGIQRRERSVTWTGTELSHGWPSPARSPSPLTTSTISLPRPARSSSPLSTPTITLLSSSPLTTPTLNERRKASSSTSLSTPTITLPRPAPSSSPLSTPTKTLPKPASISSPLSTPTITLPRPAPSSSPLSTPTLTSLGSQGIQKNGHVVLNGSVPRLDVTSAETIITISTDTDEPRLADRKDVTEVMSSDKKASNLADDTREVTRL